MNFVQMHLKLSSSSEPKETTIDEKEIDLIPGLNTFCAKKFGQYKINFVGCHSYDSRELPTFINIADHAPITINAVRHRNGFRILSETNEQYQLRVERMGKAETVNLIKEPNKVDGYFAYRYDFDLRPEERVVVFPLSDVMLFTPEQKELVGGHDCVDVSFSFIATKGLIIDGKIIPPISGALITLSFPNQPTISSLETTSNEGGIFKFGPLDAKSDYEIVATKESYVFTEFDRASQTFKAHKLCEIIASVKDEQGNLLPGVSCIFYYYYLCYSGNNLFPLCL